MTDKIPTILIFYWVKSWLSKYLATCFFFLGIVTVFSLAEQSSLWELLLNDLLFFLQITIFPFLPLVNTVCCFLATILTFIFFEKDREWSALVSCSVSPFWVVGTMVILSVLLTIPLEVITFHFSVENASNRHSENLRPLHINDQQGGGNWYFSSFNLQENLGYGLHLFLNNSEGESVARMKCEQATWDSKKGWTFKEGTWFCYALKGSILSPNPSTNKIDKVHLQNGNISKHLEKLNVPVKKVTFNELHLSTFGVDPRPFLLEQKDPILMNLKELKKTIFENIDLNQKLLAPFKYQFAKLIAWKLNGVFASILGIVLMLNSQSFGPKVVVLTIITTLTSIYLSFELLDLIGPTGILNPWVCSLLPVLSAFFAVIFVPRCLNRLS